MQISADGQKAYMTLERSACCPLSRAYFCFTLTAKNTARLAEADHVLPRAAGALASRGMNAQWKP